MNMEQDLIELKAEIRALRESVKSAHHRIDSCDKIAESVNRLVTNLQVLTEQFKGLAEKMDTAVDRMEESQKSQGERIGRLEATLATFARIEERIAENEKRLEDIEKKPGDKWEKFSWLVFSSVVTGIIGFFLGFFKKGG